ncbi:hypothetical protein K469DRAFT_693065 [Zopfia rhizophila CBS 207.26]|uniref:Mitochondrial ATPase inhibitor n=1 Tax=Zopfia rhizophila CBS 207.26 TaxID=1314779 RepID=A0A6A6EPS2_9PEZI|nr:hypothetical protein K469DRAFT_693065 [Zopfia rhizophila CBS 207.26]
MPAGLPIPVLRFHRPLQTLSLYRSLSSTPRRLLKEDADRSPEEIEKKKQEQLEKQKRGEGHWHEELGSQSESHVKADREEVGDHGDHISKLQQQTKEKSEEGKSPL